MNVPPGLKGLRIMSHQLGSFPELRTATSETIGELKHSSYCLVGVVSSWIINFLFGYVSLSMVMQKIFIIMSMEHLLEVQDKYLFGIRNMSVLGLLVLIIHEISMKKFWLIR